MKISTRDFELDPLRAKAAATTRAVFIAEQGVTTHVLLTAADYSRLVSGRASLAEVLEHIGGENIEFDPPRLDFVPRPVTFDDD